MNNEIDYNNEYMLLTEKETAMEREGECSQWQQDIQKGKFFVGGGQRYYFSW